MAEASVVGVPDALKGQLPFAFVTLSTPEHPSSAVPDAALVDEIQGRVRRQIGGIATLGGIIQGRGMIPKTVRNSRALDSLPWYCSVAASTPRVYFWGEISRIKTYLCL